MSELNPGAEQVDESADVAEDADEAVGDSHAADIDAGFDDPSDSPTIGGSAATEDGTL